MPELPEVETIRRQLEEKIVGKTIKDVEVRLPRIFPDKKEDVVGTKIVSVKRRAKVLIMDLSNGKSLMVHFKLTGQMVYSEESQENVYFPQGIPFAGNYLPSKTTHVIFTFEDGSRLFYNDNRQFGWIKVFNDSKLILTKDTFLKKLGPEPFTPEFTLEKFSEACKKWGRPVKLLLLEQDKISGIGNIYANEALFCAGIDPQKKAKELNSEETETLFNCIIKVLEMGIKYSGSSGKDESYITPDGKPGGMQEHFNVYQRDGQLCTKNCGGRIQRMELGGRGTFFCPACQK